MIIGGTGYQVVGVMEEKFFSFDHDHNALRWMNRQIYIPITTYMTRKGEPLERGKVSWRSLDKAAVVVPAAGQHRPLRRASGR